MANEALNLTLTQAAHDAIARATSLEEIRNAALTAAQGQADEAAKAAADKAEADKKAAEAAAAEVEDTVYTKTEVIRGKEFTFEAGSELELQNMITNAYRVADAVQAVPAEVVVAPVQTQATKEPTEAERAAAHAELELKFKRGDITIEQYMEQSGAVKTYLANQGISVEKLKGAVEKTEADEFTQSWQQASETFRTTSIGADWPGGERNKQLLGMKIMELGLMDAEDKVAALGKAYTALKQQNLLFEEKHEETTDNAAAAKAAADAAAAKAAADAAAKNAAAVIVNPAVAVTARTASSLFGMSSGVREPEKKDGDNGQPQPIQITPATTPAEIMAAWTATQMANGRDPNAAFLEQFSRR